jgi:hypothetical protein
MEVLLITICPASGFLQIRRLAAVSLFCLPYEQAPFTSSISCPKKRKSHRQFAPGGGILELPDYDLISRRLASRRQKSHLYNKDNRRRPD